MKDEQRTLNGLRDLASVFGIDPREHTLVRAKERIARRLYKDTACGISFHMPHPAVVVLAGYCEGFDGELPSHALTFPFTEDEFWNAVQAADEDGCRQAEVLEVSDEL